MCNMAKDNDSSSNTHDLLIQQPINFEQDFIFARLTDMFGDVILADVISNICIQENWQGKSFSL